ncbi:MAG: glycoside hydrolase family 3 C-terminal domain-containing protein [Agathobacter sp.]|nr:glycoside hydrolase family 3 C-terminal domain-containing protein [Agathobacter sp.]
MAKFALTAEQKQKVADLVSQMTVTEKIGQLHQLSPSIVGGFDVSFEELIEMMTDGRISQEEFGRIMAGATRDFHEDDIRAGKVGSFLLDDPEKARELQKIAVEESRMGIPLIFGLDVIHGFQTIFPIPLAETCTWDEKTFEESATIAAREASAHNVHWTFAPMVDISRDARWGRIAESPGEDPYLASVYSRAKVRGFQGSNPADVDRIAACLKHFVAYGAAESGQDYNTVSMANSMLHNAYLPPVKAAVEEGAMTVMAAFNDYNGVPCTVNKYLLRDVLKENYDFDGFVVSDATAMKECITHGIAADGKGVAKLSMNAGMDMDMNSWVYHNDLEELIESGQVPMEQLDEAVTRILSVKMALGLFDRPYVAEDYMRKYDVTPEEHTQAALEAAKKSIVLLKNDNVLPLAKNQKIALVGELADMPTEVVGTWAMSYKAEDCISILQGMKNAGADVVYKKCCGVESDFVQEELDEVAKDADVIVAVVGELVSMSGEASSRADITLPGQQRKLLEAALATGKPVVALLMNGRPLALSWEDANVPAIVECWHLGVQMGNAVASVVFGDYNPSGKLSATFPATTGQCPRYYNHPNTGRPGSRSKFTSRYLDAPVGPLYPFGYGLSYTTFSYDNLKVEEAAEELKVTVTVTNTGDVAGEETVQVYVRDVVGSMVRPVKELKAYAKVNLAPGASSEVSCSVAKKDLGFYNDNMEYLLEDGEFIVFVGGNSRDCLSQSLQIQF